MSTSSKGRRLTGVEQAFIAHELHSKPGNAQLAGLLRFTGEAPSLKEFISFGEPRLRSLPALKRVLQKTGRIWYWRDLEDSEFSSQIKEWVAEPGPANLPAAVSEIMAGQLNPGRPPWELWLIRGYAEGEWASIFKAHHALLDGASMVKVNRCLLGPEPTEVTAKAPILSTHQRKLKPRKSQDLVAFSKGSFRYLRRFLPLARRPFSTKGLTGIRNFSWSSLELERLTSLAKKHEVTLNDIFLASVTTALREWQHTPWRAGRVSPIWTLVPVDLSGRDGTQDLGSRIVNLRIRLPCDESDPARRLALIAQATKLAKTGNQIAVTGAGVRAMPAGLVRALCVFISSRWHVSLIASNVRGVDHAMSYQSMPLFELVPLGLVPRGHPFDLYLMTYHDRACLGFATDSTLPDGAGFCDLWAKALDELADLTIQNDEVVVPQARLAETLSVKSAH